MPISKQMVCWMTDYACYHEDRPFVKSIYPLFEELVSADDEEDSPDYQQATTRTLMHVLKDVFASNSLLDAIPTFRLLVDHAGCPQSVEETVGLYRLLKGRALMQEAEKHRTKTDVKRFQDVMKEHLVDDEDAFADLSDMNAELHDMFEGYYKEMLACPNTKRKERHSSLIKKLAERFTASELAARMSDHIFAINEVLPLPYLEIVASGFVLPAISSQRKQLNASDFVGAVTQEELHEIHKCETPEVAEFLKSNGIENLPQVLAQREAEIMGMDDVQEAQGDPLQYDDVEEFSSPVRQPQPAAFASPLAARQPPRVATPPGQIRVVIGSKRPGAAMPSSREPAQKYTASTESGGSTPSRKKKRWGDDETVALVNAVRELGEGKWKAVKQQAELDGRTTVNIKDKWRNLTKKYGREELLLHGLCAT